MIDYKPIFDKYVERLFAFDTQDAKLTISYNSHYPDPKKLEYEKAYTYLLGEFKRIEALYCYDYEYSYNMIQDQLVNFIVFIDEYKRAYEYGQAEYDFYAEFWHDMDIKLLENSIVDFKNRVEKNQQQNSKPVENKKINNMENELFDKLHIYSLTIQKVPINETTIEKIIYLNDELFEDEFKIADNYLFQKAIIDSKESAVDLVLKNLNKAIDTNCGNTIDFSDILIKHSYGLNYSDVPGQTSIKKKYQNISYTPDNFEQFRKIWLYNYIEEIKQVRDAICTIIGKPLIEPTKTVTEPNKNDFDIDNYATNLSIMVSTATRWDIKAVKKTTTEHTPYSVFTPYLDKYSELYRKFRKALRIEFDNPQNGKGFEIDMINKFSGMVKLYYNWYEEHKEETKIFDPYNPYEYIYGFVKDAELELNKYFGKINTPRGKKTETSAPAIDRTINKSEFEKYFKSSFKGIGEYNINHFEKMVEDLRLNRTPRVFAQIALLIYESKQLNSNKPTYFSEWYKVFCECVGCERKKYDPKDLRPISKNVMSLFNYLLD